MLPSSSPHLHAALYIGLLATVLWCWAYQDPLSHHLHTCGVWEHGDGLSAGCHHSFGPKSPIAALSYWVSPASSLFSPCLPFLVRWCTRWKSLAVCIRSPNALCQLAVPAVTVEIHLSADVPSVWQRVASSSILKGLPWPGGTGDR